MAKKMIVPTRLRRFRVLATFLLGAVMLYAWSKNIGPTDPRAYRKGLVASVGGGAVLRNSAQEAPLQAPPVHEPPSAPPEHPPAAEALRPPSSPHAPSPPENLDRALPGQANAKPTTTTRRVAGDPLDEAQKPTPPPSVQYAKSDASRDTLEKDDLEGEEEDLETETLSSVVRATTTTTAKHWMKLPEHYPVSTTMQLPAGTSRPFPRIQRATERLAVNGVDRERRAAVKAATMHSWSGYRQFAFGMDEVKPVSGGTHEAFNNWGATLVDALDTLWLMGMKDEFEEAVERVGKIDFTTTNRSDIPLFETVIRYLGGLIAAYDVSGKVYRVLLDQAVQLAEVLYGAFDTPNRVPMTYYRWDPESAKEPRRASNRIVLAELGTLSLEFTRLAQLTGEPKYYDAIARLTDMLEEWQFNTTLPGMWPHLVDGSGCGPLPPIIEDVKPQRPVQQQLANTNAIPPGVTRESKELVNGLGQPGDLDEPQTKHHADLPVNQESHGNIYRRQLEEDLNAVDDELEMLGSVEEIDDERGRLIELDAKAASVMVQSVVARSEHCGPQGLTSPLGSSMLYTLAGGTDSMFEYLPKEYMLLGGQVDKYRTMYLESMKVAMDKLLYQPMNEEERDILMSGAYTLKPNYSQPAEERGYIGSFSPEIAHLTCFAGGMFAMGGVIFDQPDHVDIGRKLTEGCVWAYNVTQTGIMPEGAIVTACKDTWGECKWNESAWWAELDPYHDTRENAQSSRPAPLHHHHPPLLSKPQMFESNRAYYRPRPEGDTGPVAQGLRHEAPHKRQLEDTELVEPETTATTSTSASATSSSKGLPPATSYPANNVNDLTQTTATLTQEEYVKKKITDQRLPPGFVRWNSRVYILRPEAIESVFYMYRITGDPHYRDVGWNMFQAVEKYTRSSYGYSAIKDVSEPSSGGNKADSMESFWLAETLKYFYLLFDDPAKWSLDDWVLNTEAHLFRRPEYEFAKGTALS